MAVVQGLDEKEAEELVEKVGGFEVATGVWVTVVDTEEEVLMEAVPVTHTNGVEVN